MGLDSSFKSLLEVPVSLESKTGTDTWGNETYGVPSNQLTFIDASNASFGRSTPTSFRESQQTAVATIYFDAIGVKIADRITFDSIPHYVTDLVTYKDEFGDDLLQVVTVSDQKKG